MISKKIINLIFKFRYIFFLILGITIIYYPAVISSYLFHDDWDHFFSKSHSCFNSGMVDRFLELGRPLGYKILCFQFKIVSSPYNVFFSKLISLIFVYLIGISIFFFFKKINFNETICFISSLLICSLPGYYVMAMWLGSGFGLLGSLFVIISVINILNYNKTKNFLNLLFGFIFLLFSLFFYQAPVTIFISLIYIYFINEILQNKVVKFNTITAPALIFILSNLFYLIFFLEISNPSLIQNDPARAIKQIIDYRKILFIYLTETLPRAFSLWSVSLPQWDYKALVILSIYLISVSWKIFFLINSKKIVKFLLFKIFLIFFSFIIIFLSYYPSLITGAEQSPFRVTVNISLFIFCFIILSANIILTRIILNKKVKILLCSLTLLYCFLIKNTYFNLFVHPKVIEVKFLNDEFSKFFGKSVENIIVIGPETQNWKTDEILFTTSFYHNISAINFFISKNQIKNTKNIKIIYKDENILKGERINLKSLENLVYK